MDHLFRADQRPDVFSAWMMALMVQPRAKLWIPKLRPQAWSNLREAALKHGVDPARIVQGERIGPAEHLERYWIADLSLDTYPYASHTTALDALYCACPLLACSGDSFASRVAASALSLAGLADFVSEGIEAYQARLVELVQAPEELGKARAHLESPAARKALFDTPSFTRRFEEALLQIWDARNQ